MSEATTRVRIVAGLTLGVADCRGRAQGRRRMKGRSTMKVATRLFTGGALAFALVGAIGTPALAGEITGNGKPTPIANYQAGSICSFSGQNDTPDSEELFEGGRVQSFGDIVKEAIGVLGDGKGASSLVPIIHDEGPGTACRGNAGDE
jgi:hypothetical protein